MTLSIQKVFAGAAIAASFVIVGATEATAVSIKSTITADNFYGILHGNEDGSTLNFVGRNETGNSGNPGQYNWSQAETWNFNIDADDYLYVVTWDDGRVAESWLSEFEIGGQTVLTGDEDWEFIKGGNNPYLENQNINAMPSNSELESFISNGGWADTISIGTNGMSPWGTISGISGDAEWLQTASHTEGKYTIFRTKSAATDIAGVPEPTSLLGLLAVGVLGATSLSSATS